MSNKNQVSELELLSYRVTSKIETEVSNCDDKFVDFLQSNT